MPRWLGFSLAAIVLWGGWGLIGKATRLDALLMTALSTLGAVGVAAALLASPRLRQGTGFGRGMAYAFATGLFGNLGNLAYLKAFKVGEASYVAPFTALYPLVTVIVARFVLRERLNPVQALGFGLALGAVAIFSYLSGGESGGGLRLGGWILWAAATVVLFGLAAVTQKIATLHISSELSLVCFSASFIPVGAAILLWGGPFDWTIPALEWVYVALYGAGIGIGTLLLFAAYRWGNASVVTAITGLNPALTALLAIPIFKEPAGPGKIAAAVLALAAGTALSYEGRKPDA